MRLRAAFLPAVAAAGALALVEPAASFTLLGFTLDTTQREWTMVGDFVHPETGATMRKRSVIRVHDGDRHTMEQYLTDDSGAEFKTMEIDFIRV